MRSAISSSVAGRNGAPSALRSLISLTRWSPRTTTISRPRPSRDDGEGLQQRARRQPEPAGHLVDRRQPRGRHLLGLRQRRGQLDGLGLGGGDLDVRGVPGGERHVVLAGRARRHVLVGARAAHHPDVGLHPVPLEADAVEDPVVGRDVLVVAGLQALLVAVEGVGVLHDELARAQHPGARARLVALLDLEVVEDQRQVAVGAHRVGDVEGHGLLVRHGQHHLGPAAVLQAEELGPDRVVAPAAPPQLGRVQDGHQHLLPADRVDLLAHDLHDLLVHLPAGRQPGPQPGAELAHQAGAHEQLMRDRLRVGGRLAFRRQEEAGHARHGAGNISGPSGGSRGRSRAAGGRGGCALAGLGALAHGGW